MRAVVLESFGDLPVVRDIPVPEPGAGQLLIRVAGSSINAFDRAVAAGFLKGRMEHRFPVVLGRDFSGIVESVGEGVERFAAGDRVFGMITSMVLGDGGFAEYTVVAEAMGTAPLPAGIDLARAGALGIGAITAYAAVKAADPSPGQAILVVGATGSVGSYAVQLAAARGARVIATARPDGAAFVRDLGAVDVVDHSGDLRDHVRALAPGGLEAVIHLAGDAMALADLVAPGGRILSTAGLSADSLPGRDISVASVMGTPSAEALDAIAALVASGALRIPITRTYTLEDAPAAFTAAHRILGKASVVVGNAATA
jgi:NADPH:quinone reductase-like Zn-dependent oxidoreductase